MHFRWRRHDRRSIAAVCVALSCLFALPALSGTARADGITGTVRVELPAELANQPIRGRLFFFCTQRGGTPQNAPDWFRPEPFFARDVEAFQPGSAEVLDDTADSFPKPLSQLKPGRYHVQALLDHDIYSPVPAQGANNLYSDVATLEVGEANWTIDLKLAHKVPAAPIPERAWIRPLFYRSELLSRHFGRDVEDRAVVILPKSYAEQPQRRYPVLFEISGFGGTLPAMAHGFAQQAPGANGDNVEFIRVLLTGECKWGHHVYADSPVNGPRGRVLTEELIPKLDREFRTVAAPQARFVTGHSSGGWSSLWLQVNYPDVFGGVWSSSPDPVDFRDYQATNLYADPPNSLYFNDQGHKKPIARAGTMPILWYPDFGRMDDCLGRGGQLRSFEAVFSPINDRGEPLRMWDRETGRIQPAVVEAWKKYDINLVVRQRWPEIGSKLTGKIHMIMGEIDTFYLEGATRLLKATFQDLGSDAEVTLVPGADHGSVITPAVMARFRQQMSETYLKYYDREGQPRAANCATTSHVDIVSAATDRRPVVRRRSARVAPASATIPSGADRWSNLNCSPQSYIPPTTVRFAAESAGIRNSTRRPRSRIAAGRMRKVSLWRPFIASIRTRGCDGSSSASNQT